VLWVVAETLGRCVLERMFVGVPPGSYNRLLDVSTAVTGTTFFVPTASMREELAEPAAEPSLPTGSSLRIGSLRGRSS
jgi:putative iron-dependent peroxidase